MTPEKQRQKLAGQTSLAQKVYQYVPIQEPWTAADIARAMVRASGSQMDGRTLLGCLGCLKDSGLVREVSSSRFQRTAVSQPITPKPKEAMPAPQKPEVKPAAPASAIDLLAGIAKSMRALAGEIETAAIAIEEGQAKAGEEVQKLRQLQALLKGLA